MCGGPYLRGGGPRGGVKGEQPLQQLQQVIPCRTEDVLQRGSREQLERHVVWQAFHPLKNTRTRTHTHTHTHTL